MAVLTPLVTAEQLRLALSPTTYMAIFDDANSGVESEVDASAQVALVLKRAHTRVISRLPALYKKLPDGLDAQVPDLLVDAELNYAQGMAFDRHVEYTRTFGEDPRRKACWDQAEATMALLQEAVLRIADVPPEPVPKNVGGLVTDGGQRVFLDSVDGTRNSGDF